MLRQIFAIGIFTTLCNFALAVDSSFLLAESAMKDGLYEFAASQFSVYLNTDKDSVLSTKARLYKAKCLYEMAVPQQRAGRFSSIWELTQEVQSSENVTDSLKEQAILLGWMARLSEYASLKKKDDKPPKWLISAGRELEGMKKSSSSEVADKALFFAAEAMRLQKDYLPALTLFDTFINKNTGKNSMIKLVDKASVRLGECYVLLHDFELGRTWIQGFIDRREKSPFLSEAAYWLGEANYFGSHWDDAVRAYSLCLNGEIPSSLQQKAMLGKGWALQKQAEAMSVHEDATALYILVAKTFEELRMLVKNDKALHSRCSFLIGQARYYTKEYEVAYRELSSVDVNSPDIRYAAYLRGTSLLALKRYEEAVNTFTSVMEDLEKSDLEKLSPKDISILFSVMLDASRAEIEQKEIASAKKLLLRRLEIAKKLERLHIQVQTQIELIKLDIDRATAGDVSASAEALARIDILKTEDLFLGLRDEYALRYYKASALSALNALGEDLFKASHELRVIILENIDSQWGLLALSKYADIALRREKYDIASESYQQLSTDSRTTPSQKYNAYLGAALAAKNLERYAEAVLFYNRIVSNADAQTPYAQEAAYLRVAIHDILKDDKSVIWDCLYYENTYPTSKHLNALRILRAEKLLGLKRLDEATKVFDIVKDISGEIRPSIKARAYLGRAKIAILENDNTKAESSLMILRNKFKDLKEATEGTLVLAALLENVREDESRRLYNLVIKSKFSEFTEEAAYKLGIFEQSKEQWLKADEAFEKCLSARGKKYKLLAARKLGEMRAEQQEYASAARAFASIVYVWGEEKTDKEKAKLSLARYLALSDNKKEALHVLGSIELFPTKVRTLRRAINRDEVKD